MAPKIAHAIRTLKDLPGLDVEVKDVEAEAEHRTADAFLEIGSATGHSFYVLEEKRSVTTTTLPVVLDQLEHLEREFGRTPLLTSPYITPGVAERLLEARVQFFDAAGNAYLDGPAAYVVILGKKPETKPSMDVKGFTTADLRLIYAFLARPGLLNSRYRWIQKATSLSLGKISDTMQRLEDAGYLRRIVSKRILLDPSALLERWEFGYLEQLRPSLQPSRWRVGPGTGLDDIYLAALEIARSESLMIGGEYAVDAFTNLLKPASLTLHVPPGRSREIARKLRLPPAKDRSDVTMLERFVPAGVEIDRPGNGSPFPVAHPILVRAELLAQNDDRLREVAARLLEETIIPGIHDVGA